MPGPRTRPRLKPVASYSASPVCARGNSSGIASQYGDVRYRNRRPAPERGCRRHLPFLWTLAGHELGLMSPMVSIHTILNATPQGEVGLAMPVHGTSHLTLAAGEGRCAGITGWGMVVDVWTRCMSPMRDLATQPRYIHLTASPISQPPRVAWYRCSSSDDARTSLLALRAAGGGPGCGAVARCRRCCRRRLG